MRYCRHIMDVSAIVLTAGLSAACGGDSTTRTGGEGADAGSEGGSAGTSTGGTSSGGMSGGGAGGGGAATGDGAAPDAGEADATTGQDGAAPDAGEPDATTGQDGAAPDAGEPDATTGQDGAAPDAPEGDAALDPCPSTQPTDGTACSARISCQYDGNTLCACGRAGWSCAGGGRDLPDGGINQCETSDECGARLVCCQTRASSLCMFERVCTGRVLP